MSPITTEGSILSSPLKQKKEEVPAGFNWRRLTFQNGSMPVGKPEPSNAFRTAQVSTMMNAMLRHIEASMMPKRGLTHTSSRIPKLYSRLMV